MSYRVFCLSNNCDKRCSQARRILSAARELNAVLRTISRGLRSERHCSRIVCVTIACFTFPTYLPCQTKSSPKSSQDFPELLLTQEGMLAINTHEWPWLGIFVCDGDTSKTAEAWIYISSAPIGPKEDAKTSEEYLESDIAGFQQPFKDGIVKKETPIGLPQIKGQAPVYTFLSGESHNASQQIIYISENKRILILALSAKNKEVFEKSLIVFRQFVQSYRGSITPSSPENKVGGIAFGFDFRDFRRL